MRAVILAAGRGTRLAPITNDRPKCLVELGGSSLLDHQIATLKSLKITDITVIAGYRAECLSERSLRIVLNPDYATSNMVYTLFCANDLMVDDTDLLIAYGDIVYEPHVLQALMSCTAPMCVIVDREWRRYWELRMTDPLSDAETLKIDSRGMIKTLGKKPHSYDEIQGQYIGLIKVRRDHVIRFRQLYDAMDPDSIYDGKSRKQMYMTSFIQHAIDSGWQVQSVPIANGWLEVDTYAELKLYRQMHADGTLAKFFRFGNHTPGSINSSVPN